MAVVEEPKKTTEPEKPVETKKEEPVILEPVTPEPVISGPTTTAEHVDSTDHAFIDNTIDITTKKAPKKKKK